MFRPLRKKNNEIDAEAINHILHTARRGILAVHGDDGYPYAVPLNFYYDEAGQKIYFHGTRAGHKVDALKACDKVCFTVCGEEMIKAEPWAPFVQSVVVFGKCHFMESDPESLRWIKRLAMKYFPDENLVDQEIAAAGNAVQMYEIDIDHLCGKEVQER